MGKNAATLTSSLGEGKHLHTSRVLAETSFRLAIERGLDRFVIDDVTSSAGYSRRTFANHFSCKEEAVAEVTAFAASDALRGLTVEPGDASVIDALDRAARLYLNRDTVGQFVRLQALTRHHPALRPHMLAVCRRVTRLMADALPPTETGTTASLDVMLLISACSGILSAIAVGDFIDPALLDDETGFDEAIRFTERLVDLSLSKLRSGFTVGA